MKIQHIQLKQLRSLAAALAALVALSACQGDFQNPGPTPAEENVGSIVAQAIWSDAPVRSVAVAANSAGQVVPMVAPPAVVTVRATVSGPDMSDMTSDFPAGSGSGAITGIPVGANRTLTLQGLDASNVPIYEGSAAGISIFAGGTTDVGFVILTLVALGPPGFDISATTGLATTETGGTDTITIRLNTDPVGGFVELPITSTDTTEVLLQGGSSPSTPVASILLTFTTGNWSTPQTVTIIGQADSIADGNQVVSLTTGAATSIDLVYSGIDPSDITVTNADNDVAGITVAPTSGLLASEAGGTDTFTVVLNTLPTGSVTIPVTSGDTTEALVQGGDSPGTPVASINLTFTTGDWSTPQAVTVLGQDDAIDDGNQTITISTGAAIGAAEYVAMDAADVSVTITDNDNAGISVTPTSGLVTTEGGGTDTFDVVLDTQPSDTVSFSVTSGNTGEVLVQGGSSPSTPVASILLTFTTGNWSTPQTVTAVGQDDAIDDGNQAITLVTAAATSTDGNYSGLNASNVSVTNNDNDNAGISVTPTSGLITTEAGGTDTFTVVLDTQPTANVTIGVSSPDTTEVLVRGGDSPVTAVSAITLTFTDADWATPQIVTVVGQDEAIDDGNQAITIVTAAAASSDLDYNTLNPSDVSVTNNDNDAVGVTVNPTSGLTTTEAGGTDTFTVVLDSEPTATVTIGVSTGDGTEVLVQGGDSPGTPVSAITLTFTTGDWSTPQTVTVVGQDDAISDGPQAVTIVTGAASGGDYAGLAVSDVSVTNNDDDTPGITVIPISGLVTTEAGGTDSFTVVLNTAPTDNVTIPVTSADTTEALVQGGDSPGTPVSTITLTFTTGNWSTPQTVTVVGQDDAIDDGSQGITITTGDPASVGDAGYNGLTAVSVDDVSVTNTDDDVTGVNVTPTTGLTTTEAGGTDTFTVVLDTQPLGDVTIPVSSSDTTEVLVQGGDSPSTPAASITLTFTNSDWSTPQTVTVVGQDDALDDGLQAVTILTGDPASVGDAGYDALTAGSVDDVSVSNSDDDAVGITVTPTTGLITDDSGGTDTFTVVLDAVPLSDVTIGVSSGDAGEVLVRGGDSPVTPVASITLTFTGADWSTPQTVTVVGQADSTADGNQAVTITTAAAASSDGAYNGINPDDVSVTNNDTDTASIIVTPTSGLVTTEDGGTDTFTVVLGTIPSGDVTIPVSSGNTAEVLVKGGDSPSTAIASITLTFTGADWSTPQTVTVVGQEDAGAVDGNQAVTVTTGAAVSSDGAYNGLNPDDVSVTNNDNDNKGITVNPITGLTTTEAGGTDTFTVVLNAAPTGDVTLPVSSGDTSEVLVKGGNSPSVATSAITLTFTNADWSTPQTVTLVGQDDIVVDGDQAVTIVTGDPASTDGDYDALTAANVDDVSVTNTDDGELDPPSVSVSPTSITAVEGGVTGTTFSVVLGSTPDGNVVITLTNNDASETSIDKTSLTFDNGTWSTPQVVTVTGVDDAVTDGNQTVSIGVDINVGLTTDTTGYAALNPTDVQVTVIDSSVAGVTVNPTTGLSVNEELTTNTTFTVVLNKQPSSGNVVINVASQDTTELSVSPATLTFGTGDWFTEQTVTVTAVDDAIADGNVTATVVLTMDTGLTADPAYDAINPPDVQVTNLDNDAPGVTVSPAGTLSTTEFGTASSFNVVLNTQPDNNVVIDIVSQDTTEVTVSPASLTFDGTNWDTPRTVTVFGVDDVIDDGNQTVTVTLTTNAINTLDTTGYLGINPPDVTVLNNDNDTIGVTVSPINGLVVSETGSTATFSVVLNTQPDGDVIIDVNSTDNTELSVDKAQLTFNATDWPTPQFVTVTGLADLTVDGNQSVIVSLTMNGGTTDTTGYAGLNPSDVTVINSDVDWEGVTVTPTTGLATSESGGTDSFTVVLNSAPNGDVVIGLINPDSSEVTLSRTTLTFTMADWATPQTVTISGVDDLESDGGQTLIVQLFIDTDPAITTDTTGYLGVDPADVTVTNADDDAAGVTASPLTGMTVIEGGLPDTFTVVLNTIPTGIVTIGVASSDITAVTVDRSSLSFTSSDWATPQTVTVTAVDDLTPNGIQDIPINLTVSSAPLDAAYAALDPPDPVVTKLDDDGKAISVSPLTLTTSENGSTDSFSVALSAQPSGDVVINVTSSDTTEVLLRGGDSPFTAVSGITLTYTASDWPTPQVVTVVGVNDTDSDGHILVPINLDFDVSNADATYGALTLPTPQVTNEDNEFIDEGTVGDPVSLSDGAGTLPHVGTVSDAGNSYYHITGLVSGVNYLVSVSAMAGNVHLYVYEDSAFSIGFASCGGVSGVNAWGTSQPERCVITAPISGEIFVRAWNREGGAGIFYTVNVTEEPTGDVGDTIGNAVDITGLLPYLDTVGNTFSNYYVVKGLAPSTNYLVALNGLTGDIDLAVYDNSGFTTGGCTDTASVANLGCEATSNGSGELYIQTIGNETGNFTIDVLDPPFDEGSFGAPLDITGLLPYDGSYASVNTGSYYVVGNLIPGAPYSIVLSNITNGTEQLIYTNSGFTTLDPACPTNDEPENLNEICHGAIANSSGKFYINILKGKNNTGGATYTINVRQ